MIRNRIELAKLFAEKGFIYGAEIGVCDGRYSEILFQNIPNLKLISIDSWEGQWAENYEKAKAKLSPYKDRLVLAKTTSLDGIQYADDDSLDFVFIDAEHSYTSVKADIEAWTPKVRSGGIVSGHDYYMTRQGNMGVIQAVNEYVDKNGYELQFTRWDLEAEEKDDQQPCWWFWKESPWL